ncbi:MAG: D-alanyl-D-alanine carboxypeptidase, partial [Oscillospiraceae bacterium]|nr:D-alanyl-D-alanine carboxypeptidase [Oscillospiraceae bacterium]
MKKMLALFLAVCLLCLSPVCFAAGEPTVSAASAILVDAASGRVLFEKDAHTQRSIASTTKLLTALVAVESTPDLSRIVTITAEHWAEGTSMYLKPGEELTLEELLYGLLLQSGNDAALAIASGCAGDTATFVEWMNQWAEDLGMEDSHFANPNGLDEEGHYSTAYDMALLARAVLKNDTLCEIVATRSATKAGRSLSNHNKLLWQYEGCTGMKTGYTTGAGRTLVSSATRNGQTLVCVTLNDRNDWEDHAALFDYGFGSWPVHS